MSVTIGMSSAAYEAAHTAPDEVPETEGGPERPLFYDFCEQFVDKYGHLLPTTVLDPPVRDPNSTKPFIPENVCLLITNARVEDATMQLSLRIDRDSEHRPVYQWQLFRTKSITDKDGPAPDARRRGKKAEDSTKRDLYCLSVGADGTEFGHARLVKIRDKSGTHKEWRWQRVGSEEKTIRNIVTLLDDNDEPGAPPKPFSQRVQAIREDRIEGGWRYKLLRETGQALLSGAKLGPPEPVAIVEQYVEPMLRGFARQADTRLPVLHGQVELDHVLPPAKRLGRSRPLTAME